MTAGLLRAEVAKVATTRLWWVLLVPVVLLAVLVNLAGGTLFASGTALEGAPYVLVSVAFTLAATTTVLAALHGAVAAAGEFRHRTITTTYLTAPRGRGGGRGAVLLAKTATAAAVGALYGLAAGLVGLLAGAAVGGAATPPSLADVAGLLLTGCAVPALWGALGVAVATLTANQVAALVVVLGYALGAEGLLSLLLNRSDVAGLTSWLPGNAGDVALYGLPARAVAPVDGFDVELVESLAGVTDPPAWWVALLVLAGWAVLATAAAWWVGGRRDVT